MTSNLLRKARFSTSPKEATWLRISVTLVSRLAYAFTFCCSTLVAYGWLCKAAMAEAGAKALGKMNIEKYYEDTNQGNCSKLEEYTIKFGEKNVAIKFDTETYMFHNPPGYELAHGMCASNYNTTESIASNPLRNLNFYNESYTQVKSEDPSLGSKMSFIFDSHVWVPILTALSPIPICLALFLVLYNSQKSGVYYRPGKIYWRRILSCIWNLIRIGGRIKETCYIPPKIYVPGSIVDLIQNLCFWNIASLLSLRFCSPLYYSPGFELSKKVNSVFCYIYLALLCLFIIAQDVFVYPHEALITELFTELRPLCEDLEISGKEDPRIKQELESGSSWYMWVLETLDTDVNSRSHDDQLAWFDQKVGFYNYDEADYTDKNKSKEIYDKGLEIIRMLKINKRAFFYSKKTTNG